VRIGLKLATVFSDAGLAGPQMLEAARVESGPTSPLYAFLEQQTRQLLPAMARTGVATADEVGIDTLAARLREEAVSQHAALVFPRFVGAWTHTEATEANDT
jgi:hypothetical protein